MIWDALGCNISNVGTATYSTAYNQLLYMKSYGINKIRIHLPDSQDSAQVTRDLLFVQAAKALGFSYTMFGGSSNSFNNPAYALSQRNWPTFVANQTALCQQAVAIGVDEFQVGNEEELHTFFASSLTVSANVATLVTTAANDYQTGDTITMYNFADTAFNSTFTITVTNSTTFTFPITHANGTIAVSGGHVTDIPLTDMVTKILALATTIKAIYPTLTLSYSVPQSYEQAWAANASIAPLDFICSNQYGNNSLDTFAAQLAVLTSAYPAKVKLTEFNVNSTWTNTIVRRAGITAMGFDELVTQANIERINVARTQGVIQGYAFTWQDSANLWALSQQAGGFRSQLRYFVPRLTFTMMDN